MINHSKHQNCRSSEPIYSIPPYSRPAHTTFICVHYYLLHTYLQFRLSVALARLKRFFFHTVAHIFAPTGPLLDETLNSFGELRVVRSSSPLRQKQLTFQPSKHNNIIKQLIIFKKFFQKILVSRPKCVCKTFKNIAFSKYFEIVRKQIHM